MADVALSNVKKTYGKVEVVHGIDLEVKDGEFVVFVGPSGCGKSTLLRMIAGLEDITNGELSIGGRRANDSTPTERGIAMVFQNYALYPHMTVEQNIGFGLKMAGVPKDEVRKRTDAAARALRLTDYLKRRPAALSGGQRQRVAIGRAIVREPLVFLFDEPLSNLDAELRVSMRIEIARLHRQLASTMIYVTHDQTEAMTLADRIVVLNNGRVEQIGTPQELYERPANIFVAGFIGSPAMNIIGVDSLSQELRDQATAISAVKFGIRPEHLSIGEEGDLHMLVEDVEYLGGTGYVYGTVDGRSIVVEYRSATPLAVGERVAVAIDRSELHFFDNDGKRVVLPVC